GVGVVATAVGDIREDLPGMSLMHAPAVSKASVNGGAGAAAYFNAKPLATPATRRLARELGVDLRSVPPTGPNGRVTNDDVKHRGAPHEPAPPPASAVKPAPMSIATVSSPQLPP